MLTSVQMEYQATKTKINSWISIETCLKYFLLTLERTSPLVARKVIIKDWGK